MASKDYYSILGVSRKSTEKEIKDAYRRLARRLHPDVNPGDKSAEARFKEINQAYEVLSAPEKRAKYDQFGEQWQYADQFARRGAGTTWEFTQERASPFTEDQYGTFDDILRQFGRGGRVRTRRGQDIEAPVEVTLEEACQGATRVITLDSERLELKIPAGVKDGSRVRFAGKGNPGFGGGERGDLYLVVSVMPHKQFSRKGDDLEVEVPVPLTVAMLGGEVEAPTLKGKVMLKIPPETQNGRAFRLKGLGMPRLGDPKAFGDLLAVAKVMLPGRLTQREKELFRELAELRKEGR